MPFPMRQEKDGCRMAIWLEATTVERANIGFTWNTGLFGRAWAGVIYGEYEGCSTAR